jgi:hypothetical protein
MAERNMGDRGAQRAFSMFLSSIFLSIQAFFLFRHSSAPWPTIRLLLESMFSSSE